MSFYSQGLPDPDGVRKDVIELVQPWVSLASEEILV